MVDEKEVWLDLYGFDGYYEVSDLGRVRSLPREVRSRGGYRTIKGRVLKGVTGQDGYRYVTVSVDGQPTKRPIHQFVYESFHGGPAREGLCVSHKNKVKTDNRPSNLEALSWSQSHTLNYQLGASTERGIGLRTRLRADELDKILGKTDAHQSCMACNVEKPIEQFAARGNRRVSRVCNHCTYKRAGVVYVGKVERIQSLAKAGLKECSKCQSTKPLTEFNTSRHLSGGVRIYCRECERAYGREQDAKRRAKGRSMGVSVL